MATRDYYQVLGVSPQASEDVLKKAYRKLAREFHPDHHQGPGKDAAEARFKEISAAYDVLGDPEKRKAYDQMRQFGPDFAQRGPGTSPFGRRSAGGHTGSGGFSEAFGAGMGGSPLEDVLAAMFGGARPTATPEPSSELPVEISLEEAATGTSRDVLEPRTGKRLRVKIPAGVTTGSKVRAGEILANVAVRPHSLFERDGDNLKLELPLTFWEAIDGSELEVPTLDGAVKMKIPPRTQSGRVFRLKGKGMPHLKAEGRGDLLVKAVIHLPPDIDEQALALWRRLSSMTPYNPRAHMRRGG